MQKTVLVPILFTANANLKPQNSDDYFHTLENPMSGRSKSTSEVGSTTGVLETFCAVLFPVPCCGARSSTSSLCQQTIPRDANEVFTIIPSSIRITRDWWITDENQIYLCVSVWIYIDRAVAFCTINM